MTPHRSYELAPVEVASGIVFGTVADPTPLPEPVREHPVAALERACLPFLERPPCVVSFSGGVDSSLVLAAATRIARREGLPPPIPATNRFPDAPLSHESDWQELVVGFLGLQDWVRLEFTDELDAVGPVATRALARHGLLWPFNSHFHVPLLEAAAGGSLLTGIGGDELFGTPRWARAVDVLAARVRPQWRDLQRVALLAAPRALRRAVLSHRLPAEFPWLRAKARRELRRRWAADEADEPARLGARIRRLHAGRPLRISLASLELLAADAGAAIAHPLATSEFGLAVARVAPWRGFDDRRAAMRALFRKLLPEPLLSRRTKAGFNGAFWGAPSGTLAASWNGEGVDPTVVDPVFLRSLWLEEEPDAHSYLLLQAAWLEKERRRMKYGLLDGRSVAPAEARP
ncbi:MAG: asparagine synthase-related protein [Thermoleophilaceae bacterium]